MVGLGARRVLAASVRPRQLIDDRLDHPAVQVAYPDAAAYARWAGRRLPTEAEWEYAARGGATTTYSWGDDVAPGGRLMANTWQGRFPYRNDGALGWAGTSPVGTFPANEFGLVDMIGNVWEWTTTQFSAHHRPDGAVQSCCGPSCTGSDRQPDPQGRLASVRAGVLPSLSPGRALTAIAGQRDDAYRLPLRGQSDHGNLTKPGQRSQDLVRHTRGC